MAKNPHALLITDKSNIAYLSNFTGSSGFMLITPKKSYLFTDFRYIERAKNTIKKGITIIDSTKLWRNPEILEKNTPYYRIAFLQTQEMNELAPMYINPSPQTVFRLFLDYLPLVQKPEEEPEPQALHRLFRNGFTVVEWGGLKR